MVVMMEDTIMIRLSFEDHEEVPRPSQKGLKQFWLFLKPQQHKTIADVTAHILYAFQLHHSCPHGIHLYIDGFPLQPFESTGILSISDTISVRKNRASISLAARLKGQEAGKDQLRGLEKGGNATSKKRKASANLHRTKKTKQCSGVQDSVRGDATASQIRKSGQGKVQSSQVNIQKQELNLKIKKRDNNGKDKIKTSNMEISAGTKSSDDIQNNANDALKGSVKTKKQYSKETLTPSKSDTSQPKSCQSGEQTRPKSERKNQNGKRDDSEPKLHWKSSCEKDKLHDKRKNEEADQNGNIREQANQQHVHSNQQSDKHVPVVTRPGHICLEPKDKAATPKSRSARRKKAKRQWLQEIKRQWLQESRMHGERIQENTRYVDTRYSNTRFSKN